MDIQEEDNLLQNVLATIRESEEAVCKRAVNTNGLYKLHDMLDALFLVEWAKSKTARGARGIDNTLVH